MYKFKKFNAFLNFIYIFYGIIFNFFFLLLFLLLFIFVIVNLVLLKSKFDTWSIVYGDIIIKSSKSILNIVYAIVYDFYRII